MTNSEDVSSGTNYIDIGTYSTAGMRDADELVWIDTEEDYWWTSYVTGVKFGGGTGLTNAYSIE